MLQQIVGYGIDESLRVHSVQLLGSCSLYSCEVFSKLLSQGDFIWLLFDKKKTHNSFIIFVKNITQSHIYQG